MTDYEKLRADALVMLSNDESVEPFPYNDKTDERIYLPDAGNITIGIGRNLSARGLTHDEIAYIFNNDFKVAYDAAFKIFPNFLSYTEGRQLAIINMIFNMGEGTTYRGFRSFKNTIAAIELEQWEDAAMYASQSSWAKQLPQRSERIIKLLRGQ